MQVGFLRPDSYRDPVFHLAPTLNAVYNRVSYAGTHGLPDWG